MTTILVTGATGTVGSSLMSALSTQGQTVRAFIHHPAGAKQLSGSGAQIALGDFADPASVRAALHGVDTVFLACGNIPEQVEYECAVIDEAKESGVQRVVKLSARGAATGSPAAYWDWHGLIERHLQSSGIPSVVLRPSFLMTNLLGAAEQVRQQGMLFAPAAGARISMIDPRDVAAVAAVALTADGHDGNTYVLTGPEAISYQQVAQDLSVATNRSVGFVDIPPQVATAALIDAGLPPFAARQVVTVFGELRAGVQAETTGTVEAVIGRPARSFAAFARDYAGAFAGAEVGSSLSA
jgi:uncharacterized protein YbjT (DUF2867 family)